MGRGGSQERRGLALGSLAPSQFGIYFQGGANFSKRAKQAPWPSSEGMDDNHQELRAEAMQNPRNVKQR